MHLTTIVGGGIGFDRVGDWFSYVLNDVLFDFSSEKKVLIRLIIVALVAVIVWTARGTLGVSKTTPEKAPANLGPDFTDEQLEGRRLERVLGLGLYMAAGIAIALPVYFLREPDRTRASATDYQEQAIERGHTLFANAADTEFYDSTKSQQCANCHGSKGEGGSAPVTIAAVRKDPDFCLDTGQVTLPPEAGATERRGPFSVEKAVEMKIAQLGGDTSAAGDAFNQLDDEEQTAAAKRALMGDVLPTELPRDCQPSKGAWAAPPLNTVLLRFPKDDKGHTQVTDIITYGRPGTPMQAFGVPGGGAKNEQAISDLVAYLETIQISSEEAMKQNTKQSKISRASDGSMLSSQAYATSLRQAGQNVVAQQKALEQAEEAVPAAEEALTAAEEALNEAKKTDDPGLIEPAKSKLVAAERKVKDAKTALTKAQAQFLGAKKWEEARADVTLGQVLFETHCARCHTKNWSIFDASNPYSTAYPAPGPSGGGAFGYNLREQSTLSQFPDIADQIDFVTNGSKNQKQYGVRGIGTGRMPGFGLVLSAEEIKAIVEYERSLAAQPDAWTVTAPTNPSVAPEAAK